MPHFYRIIQSGLILLSGFAGLHIRFYDRPIPNNFYWVVLLFSALLFLFLGGDKKSGDLSETYTRLKVLSNKWWQTFAVVLLVILLTQSSLLFSRIWLLSWGVGTWVLLMISDLICSSLISNFIIQPSNVINIAIIGHNHASQRLLDYVSLNPWSGCVLNHHAQELSDTELAKIERMQLDEIWICLTLDEANQFTNVLDKLSTSSAKIKFSPDLFMLRLLNHGISEVAGVPMIDVSNSPFEGRKLYLKNLEDFFLSFIFCILLMPVFLTLAVLVKLNSKGPVFYRQTRVGLNGKPFEMLKFRSMPVDTERDGARWGGSESKVVDSFSLFLRKYNLDELPQFFNVLRGQMSIVGPRPERVEFIDKFAKEIPGYAKKHLVKAGITGWAQIHGLRGDTDLHKRIEYDLYYIENWSLLLDLKIIFITAIEPFISKHSIKS
ncbi:exopolysaccharide biosynthesis polyprenyl glycosylphosphotransferase [Polynucleobacter sp. MWH-HuK1]|uniref:exopolysaccharide biosynthesis polyprenyl glycosylphosphotransferase n=1 Tax=Polynucleobacter sp. MWH-HuK1 TaxID=1743158 RepID=UPI001C0D0FE4|nr:exopolysaccharide biosynthesis polyprenyl glycosylphosphotransferase [Polynucleobacter sp. MWH-HuK1]MBU3564467.1 exopolysaccharide biosynthesis polyprenyl glycosylphosphotransferase [Polynucleobacter sp. MWH-HuK1]